MAYVHVGCTLVRLSDEAHGFDLFFCCDGLTQLVLVQLQLVAVWGACAVLVFWQAQPLAQTLHPCIWTRLEHGMLFLPWLCVVQSAAVRHPLCFGSCGVCHKVM